MKKNLLFLPAFLLGLGALSAQTVIFSENFEGTTGTSLPASWTQSTLATDGGWKSGTALSSTYFTIPAHTRYLATNDDGCNCDKSNDFLKTPSISLAGATYPKLVFDVLSPGATYSGSTESMKVEVSTDGGTTWTVLETLPQITAWTSHSVDLTSYAGMTVMVGFRYNDGSGWLFGAAIDNLTVIDPPAKEATVTSVIMNKYVLAGSQTVKAVLESFGGPTVTSAIMNYAVDGGTAVTQTFSPALGYGQAYTATFTTTAPLTVGLHTIKAWVSDINGTGPDATPANDTAMCVVTVQATQPAKSVLVEEFTGAWCGYCPRGGVALQNVTSSDPLVIGAAIHDNDNMMTTEGNTVITAYASGFPSGMVDRAYFAPANDWTLDDSQWSTLITSRKAEVVPATVSLSAISYNATTRVISVTVNATFVGDVKGNFSLNCYVTENHVYGPLGTNADNNWNQHSYYYGDNTSPFYNVGYLPTAGDPSLAYLRPNEYQHNHVVNKMMGGAYGDNTVIPSTLVASGTTFSKTFTYTLPAANPGGAHRYNPDNIYLIGMVSEYSATVKDDRYILNLTESKLNTNPESVGPVSVENLDKAGIGSLVVYPNPASTSANIALNLVNEESVSIQIYNTLGQMVYSENTGSLVAGEHILNISTDNLTNGIYNIVVNTAKGSVAQKFTVSK